MTGDAGGSSVGAGGSRADAGGSMTGDAGGSRAGSGQERTERTLEAFEGIQDTQIQQAQTGIYGNHLPELESVRIQLLRRIDVIRHQMKEESGFDPVEHCLSRIKTEESMREKCRRRGLPQTTESALTKLYDAVGIRVVCAFMSDVYVIRDRLILLPDVELVEEKDYIRRAKPNGYRSLHLILRVRPCGEPSAAVSGQSVDDGPLDSIYAEIQLRTISQDTWAALEHQMRYKKEISGNTALISEELKRCADELASTDISMQTIRDMIRGDKIG